MDVAYLASWVSMIWVRCPLSRVGREAVIRIFMENTLEFRVALLTYQIREMGLL